MNQLMFRFASHSPDNAMAQASSRSTSNRRLPPIANPASGTRSVAGSVSNSICAANTIAQRITAMVMMPTPPTHRSVVASRIISVRPSRPMTC
jgi:hypothetical protein